MNSPQFLETRTGQRFYEATLPELVRQLTRLNDLLALHAELIERRPTEAPCECRRGVSRDPAS
jgi:hypothetical protein